MLSSTISDIEREKETLFSVRNMNHVRIRLRSHFGQDPPLRSTTLDNLVCLCDQKASISHTGIMMITYKIISGAYVRVHTHVTAASLVGTVIIYDCVDSLEREDSQTGIVRIRELFPLQKAYISAKFRASFTCILDDFARLGGEPNELPSHFAKHTYLLVRCHRRVLIPRKDQVPIRGRSIGIVKPVAEGEILQQIRIPTDGCYVRAKNRGATAGGYDIHRVVTKHAHDFFVCSLAIADEVEVGRTGGGN